MKIALDVEALGPQPGGIGRYTWELCKGLGTAVEVGDLRFFARDRLVSDPALLLGGARRRQMLRKRFGLRRWWERRQAEQALRGHLFHGPNYFLPPFVERGIITVHDLSVLRFPETHPAKRIRHFERAFEGSLSRAAHVITDTEAVRHEVIAQFGLSPDQVTAVLLGVTGSMRPRAADELAQILRQWHLSPCGYGLSISALEPRKKIGELLHAWRRLPRPLRDLYPLVLAGGAGWRNAALHDRIAEGIAEGWLRHLGFVDEALLPALYAGARLFLYPSNYEGFGLPPLEAMACGVPTIVSGSSCLPEVTAGAALLIDPENADAFPLTIERGLTDDRWRVEAIERGLERSGELTWERCVSSTIDVYRRSAA